MRDQHGIGRVDDDQVLDADRGDHAILRMDERAARVDGDTLAAAAVAVGIGVGQLRHGLPRADVAPVEIAANHRDRAVGRGLFHHRVVDRHVGRGRERRGVDLEHRVVRARGQRLPRARAAARRRARSARRRRGMRRREREHAGVPDVRARGEEVARLGERRLLDEAPWREGAARPRRRAALDVAEAGLGQRGRDAERHERPSRASSAPRATAAANAASSRIRWSAASTSITASSP